MQDILKLTGTRVLVTAGAAGIGLAIAQAFQDEGARLEICDVDPEALAVVEQSRPGITATKCDVSDRDAVDAFISAAVERLGGLDVLVNNAGIAGPAARIEDVDPWAWGQCLAVCLTGQFNCIRRAVPHLRNSDNASIVNLSSAAGIWDRLVSVGS